MQAMPLYPYPCITDYVLSSMYFAYACHALLCYVMLMWTQCGVWI